MEEDPSILADSVHSEIKTAMRQTVAHFANKYNIIAQEVKYILLILCQDLRCIYFVVI